MAPSSKMILVSKGAIVPKILFAKSVQNGCELIQVFVIKKIYVCVCNVTFFSSYLEVTKDFWKGHVFTIPKSSQRIVSCVFHESRFVFCWLVKDGQRLLNNKLLPFTKHSRGRCFGSFK